MNIPKNTVIVEVCNGAVVNVFTSTPQSVLVVDHDVAQESPDEPYDPVWLATDKPEVMDAETADVVERKLKDLAR